MAQELIIREKVKFLALGDSYTIGESVSTSLRWPVQLVTALKAKGIDCFDPRIIATTGWRTDDLKNAIQAAKLTPEYNLVSLLIGVNNYYQGRSAESYAPELEELLHTAIALAGGNKKNVFVVSIPDYGYTPFGQSNQPVISQGINAFNAKNQAIAEQLGVKYIPITDISRRGLSEPDLVAGDGLHPSGKMYAEWVTRILQHGTLVQSDDEGDNGDPDTVTGIEDEQLGLHVYPNPFQNFLKIENTSLKQRSIQIINSSGQVVQVEPIFSGTNTVSTEKLESGNYILSLSEGSETFRFRIIKI